jgi:hypothetical protein
MRLILPVAALSATLACGPSLVSVTKTVVVLP